MNALPDMLFPLFVGAVLVLCLWLNRLRVRQEDEHRARNLLRHLTNRISSESKTGQLSHVTIGHDLGRVTIYGIGFFCEYVWPTSIACILHDADANKSLLVPILEGSIEFLKEDTESPLRMHPLLRDVPVASLLFMIAKKVTHDKMGKLVHEMSMEIHLRDVEKKEIMKKIVFFNALTCSQFTLGNTFDDIILTVRRRVRRYPQRMRNGGIHG